MATKSSHGKRGYIMSAATAARIDSRRRAVHCHPVRKRAFIGTLSETDARVCAARVLRAYGGSCGRCTPGNTCRHCAPYIDDIARALIFASGRTLARSGKRGRPMELGQHVLARELERIFGGTKTKPLSKWMKKRGMSPLSAAVQTAWRDLGFGTLSDPTRTIEEARKTYPDW